METLIGWVLIITAIALVVVVAKFKAVRTREGRYHRTWWALPLSAILMVSGFGLANTGNGDSESDDSASREEMVETVPTAARPLVGNQQNTNPVFETVGDWRELVTVVEQEQAEWYKQCMVDRIGVTWEQAQQYAALVDQGHDLRAVVVSNSSTSDAEAQQFLQDEGFTGLEDQPIIQLSGFRNTQGLPRDRCNAFGDPRSQVRVSLAIPVDVNDVTKGFVADKGVLAMCSNPWDLGPPPTPTPPPPGVPTTTPPPTVPPTVPHTVPTTVPSTTTTDESTTTTTRPTTSTTRPPTTTQPPTTTPPPTTTTEPDKPTPPTTTAPPPTTAPPQSTTTTAPPPPSDSGEGGTNTTSPPTTSAPPATAPPAPPQEGDPGPPAP